MYVIHYNHRTCIQKSHIRYPEHPFCTTLSNSLERNRNEIRELLNMVVVQQRNLRYNSQTHLPEASVLATELIADLKKEYHLGE